MIDDVLRELMDDPEGDRRALEESVVRQTGLVRERVARILRLGDPWPFAKAFGNLMADVRHDVQVLEHLVHPLCSYGSRAFLGFSLFHPISSHRIFFQR